MKKIIATLAVIFSLTTSATFAYDGKDVNQSVLKSFKKEFAGAENATWQEVGSGILRVTFNYQHKNVSAFFDADGDVIATSTFVSEEHLPLPVLKAVNEKYSDFKKTEIVEYTMDNETKYLITIVNGNENMVLKVGGNGSIEVYKR
ncbi:hypothetical protein I5907_14495 [Panacibacter sp. DH6]|uniref:Beta-lactamase-inhibitor-like PepSY-like domain-containing protein n=1 Tax=Panacibacter microcysteis TaxID=2793269 RepID=A0A931E8W3_9BACT|nr:hypothetical protein [Panacibacter microcysteis]MBG9377450.1 hypothetical protein [Panacibacter microcysteis]